MRARRASASVDGQQLRQCVFHDIVLLFRVLQRRFTLISVLLAIAAGNTYYNSYHAAHTARVSDDSYNPYEPVRGQWR